MPPSEDLAYNPSMCPRLGNELVTLWFTGRHSIHWATPARADYFLIFNYTLCYDSCLSFSPFALLHPAHPASSGNLPTIVRVHGSCMYVLWLFHTLYCTLHSHGYSVLPICTYSSHLFMDYLTHTPPIWQPSKQYIHDSVCSCLLSCFVLGVFLESIVDRNVFIAILMLIVLIFFLTKTP